MIQAPALIEGHREPKPVPERLSPVPRALLGLALAFLALGMGATSSAQVVVHREGGRSFEVGIYEGVPWPIVPAPIAGPLPPAPHFPAAPTAPTPAGERIVALLGEIQANLRDTVYQHATEVRADEGVYRWDCSGMTAWILRRTARGAMRAITRERPVARDFVRAIERAPVGRSRGGWERVDRLESAMPGDLFAWRRPRGFPSRNTGHVGFLLNVPAPVAGMAGAFAVRIADATSLGHQDDSRQDDPDGGFGIGTLVFLTDASGQGSHYGWFGTESEGYVTTPIVIGRVSR